MSVFEVFGAAAALGIILHYLPHLTYLTLTLEINK